MTYPTTPIAWLNFIHTAEVNRSVMERTRVICGNISPIHALILLVLYDHDDGMTVGVSAHTIAIISGRQISHSQLAAVQARGYTNLRSIPSEIGSNIKAWTLCQLVVPQVKRIHLGLENLIRKTQHNISVHQELAAILAVHIGKPAGSVTVADIIRIRPATHLSIVTAIEHHFKVSLSDQAISDATTFGQLRAHIRFLTHS